MSEAHAAWLAPESLRPLGSRRVLVLGSGALAATVLDEVTRACAQFGGSVRHLAPAAQQLDGSETFDLVFALPTTKPLPAGVPAQVGPLLRRYTDTIGPE